MTTPDNADMTARIQAAAAAEAAGETLNNTGASVNSEPASVETPPRRRGRPSNAEKAARTAQEKINAAAGKGESAAPKAAKKKAEKTELNSGKLAGQIKGLHIIAAKITGMPFMMLSDGEAVMLAESVVGVAEQYEVTINPKVAAGLQLLATAAMIYLPRAAEFKKMQAKQAQQIPNNNEGATNVSENPAG